MRFLMSHFLEHFYPITGGLSGLRLVVVGTFGPSWCLQNQRADFYGTNAIRILSSRTL